MKYRLVWMPKVGDRVEFMDFKIGRNRRGWIKRIYAPDCFSVRKDHTRYETELYRNEVRPVGRVDACSMPPSLFGHEA